MTSQNIIDGASIFGLGVAIAALFIILVAIYFGGLVIFILGKRNGHK